MLCDMYEASDHLVDELHTDKQCLAADCLVWSHQIVTVLNCWN